MKHYKNWGTVSSGAELYMLNHAERHRKELKREHKVTRAAKAKKASSKHH